MEDQNGVNSQSNDKAGTAGSATSKTGHVNLRQYGIPQVIQADQFGHILDSFNVFDRDGGGEIDNDELGDVFKSMGLKPTPKELQQICAELDEDMSGSISFNEFLKLMVAPKFGSIGYRFVKSAVAGAQMMWSSQHIAVGMKLQRGNFTANRTDFWQVGSVRAESSLSKIGQAYFEVVFKRKNFTKGQALNGFYYVGVCTAKVESWDGLWRDDDRRNNMWGLRSETCGRAHKVRTKRTATFGADLTASPADKPSMGELCGPEHRNTAWVEGSSWGSGDVIGIFVDINKRTIFYYKNGERMDDMAAFRGFAPGEPIFPFATCTHSDASVTIAFKPLPTNKPSDVLPTSQGGSIKYYTDWSKEYMSDCFEVDPSNKTRARVKSTTVSVPYTTGIVSINRAVSIRGINAIKTDGEFYFEIAIFGEGRRNGTSLQGGNYVGIVAEDFLCWDGNWMYDNALRKHVWALHDSFGGENGELGAENVGAPTRWSKGAGLDGETPIGYGDIQNPTGHAKPLPGFGSGDRVGFMVTRTSGGGKDSDAFPEFHIRLFLNGVERGFLVSCIKAHAIWPFASLSPQEGNMVQLFFPHKPGSESPRTDADIKSPRRSADPTQGYQVHENARAPIQMFHGAGK